MKVQSFTSFYLFKMLSVSFYHSHLIIGYLLEDNSEIIPKLFRKKIYSHFGDIKI